MSIRICVKNIKRREISDTSVLLSIKSKLGYSVLGGMIFC